MSVSAEDGTRWSPGTMPPVQDEDRQTRLFCAFLDIMGFRRMVEHWDTALAHYKAFMVNLGPSLLAAHVAGRQQMMQLVPREETTPREWFFRYSFISDSIIIRAAHSFDILRAVTDISQYFLERGCLIRGGIGFGRHFEEVRDGNFFVVSEALIEAYSLESQVAIYPRVIFSARAFEAFLDQEGIVQWPGQPWSKVHLLHPLASHILQCDDDLWCVNPFFWSLGDQMQRVVRQQIETWLCQYRQQAFHDKYVWLGDLWNHVNYGPRWFRDERGLQRHALDTGAAPENRFIMMSVVKSGFNNPVYAQPFAKNEEIYNRILRGS